MLTTQDNAHLQLYKTLHGFLLGVQIAQDLAAKDWAKYNGNAISIDYSIGCKARCGEPIELSTSHSGECWPGASGSEDPTRSIKIN